MAARCGASSRTYCGRGLWASLKACISPLVVAAVLVCYQPFAKLSAASSYLEYEVKAAFLLNFTKFVEWAPSAFAGPDAPLTICIAGHDPFGRTIDQIVEGESVRGHRIVVERMQSDAQKSCQVIYFGGGATALSGVGPSTLTVGEGNEFMRQGGMISFVIDNRRVRFDINLRAATNAGLKLSSKLLSVARFVEK